MFRLTRRHAVYEQVEECHRMEGRGWDQDVIGIGMKVGTHTFINISRRFAIRTIQIKSKELHWLDRKAIFEMIAE